MYVFMYVCIKIELDYYYCYCNMYGQSHLHQRRPRHLTRHSSLSSLFTFCSEHTTITFPLFLCKHIDIPPLFIAFIAVTMNRITVTFPSLSALQVLLLLLLLLLHD